MFVKPITAAVGPMGYLRKMEVNDALIDKLARLSMLRFNENEKQAIKKDLEKMIGFIDKLRELDTSGVAPLLHMTAASNILRNDVPGTMLTKAEALQNAPQHDGTYFQVPKMIKKGS